jgi:hypothetical protein
MVMGMGSFSGSLSRDDKDQSHLSAVIAPQIESVNRSTSIPTLISCRAGHNSPA